MTMLRRLQPARLLMMLLGFGLAEATQVNITGYYNTTSPEVIVPVNSPPFHYSVSNDINLPGIPSTPSAEIPALTPAKVAHRR
jgi:hypothetical protein